MSREKVIANVGWARAFNVLAPALDDATLQVDVETLVSVLEALPGYAEVVLVFIDGDRYLPTHLMARDIPGPGRRFTSLTSGTEWFDIGSIIDAQRRHGGAQFVSATRYGEQRPSLFVSL